MTTSSPQVFASSRVIKPHPSRRKWAEALEEARQLVERVAGAGFASEVGYTLDAIREAADWKRDLGRSDTDTLGTIFNIITWTKKARQALGRLMQSVGKSAGTEETRRLRAADGALSKALYEAKEMERHHQSIRDRYPREEPQARKSPEYQDGPYTPIDKYRPRVLEVSRWQRPINMPVEIDWEATKRARSSHMGRKYDGYTTSTGMEPRKDPNYTKAGSLVHPIDSHIEKIEWEAKRYRLDDGLELAKLWKSYGGTPTKPEGSKRTLQKMLEIAQGMNGTAYLKHDLKQLINILGSLGAGLFQK